MFIETSAHFFRSCEVDLDCRSLILVGTSSILGRRSACSGFLSSSSVTPVHFNEPSASHSNHSTCSTTLGNLSTRCKPPGSSVRTAGETVVRMGSRRVLFAELSTESKSVREGQMQRKTTESIDSFIISSQSISSHLAQILIPSGC